MRAFDYNKDNHKKVIEIANKHLDTLIPSFKEKYDIELRKPDLTTSIMDYMGHGIEVSLDKVYYAGENSSVKLLQETCIHDKLCSIVVSHVLGHVALYQNSEEFRNYFNEIPSLPDDSFGYKKFAMIGIIDEGVAQEFQKEGIRTLAKEKKSMYLELPKTWIEEHTILFGSEYQKGARMISKLLKSGTKMKEIVEHPFEYLSYVKKLYF